MSITDKELLEMSDKRIKHLNKRLTFKLNDKERRATLRMIEREMKFNLHLCEEMKLQKFKKATWGIFQTKEEMEMFNAVMKNLPPQLQLFTQFLPKGIFNQEF